MTWHDMHILENGNSEKEKQFPQNDGTNKHPK